MAERQEGILESEFEEDHDIVVDRFYYNWRLDQTTDSSYLEDFMEAKKKFQALTQILIQQRDQSQENLQTKFNLLKNSYQEIQKQFRSKENYSIEYCQIMILYDNTSFNLSQRILKILQRKKFIAQTNKINNNEKEFNERRLGQVWKEIIFPANQRKTLQKIQPSQLRIQEEIADQKIRQLPQFHFPLSKKVLSLYRKLWLKSRIS